MRVRGEYLVRIVSDTLHVGPAGCRTDAVSEPYEDQFGPVEVRVPASDDSLERRREDPLGEQGACAHRGVVGDQALVPDGRERRRAHDLKAGRRYVEGGVGSDPVADEHGFADMFVEYSEGGRADDDLIVRGQAVPGQDRWGHDLAEGACEQDGDSLPVDLDVVVVEPAPGGYGGVVSEHFQSLWRDVVGGIEGVAPVPPVERQVRDRAFAGCLRSEARLRPTRQQGRCPPAPSALALPCDPAWFEGEAHPNHAGNRHPGRFGAAGET